MPASFLRALKVQAELAARAHAQPLQARRCRQRHADAHCHDCERCQIHQLLPCTSQNAVDTHDIKAGPHQDSCSRSKALSKDRDCWYTAATQPAWWLYVSDNEPSQHRFLHGAVAADRLQRLCRQSQLQWCILTHVRGSREFEDRGEVQQDRCPRQAFDSTTATSKSLVRAPKQRGWLQG